MNEKELLQSTVYEEMMNRAQQCYDTVEIRYDERLDKVYAEKQSVIVFTREDIAKHVLAVKGINPLNFEEVLWTGSLDIFLGPVLAGDNAGDGPVWFTVERSESNKSLIGYYTICQEL